MFINISPVVLCVKSVSFNLHCVSSSLLVYMKFQQIDRQCSKIIQTIFIEQRKIKSAPLAIHYGSLLFYFMIPSFVVLFLCVYLVFHLDRVCVCVCV